MSLWVNFAIISTRAGSRTHDPQFSGSEVYVSGERPGRIWCREHETFPHLHLPFHNMALGFCCHFRTYV